MECPWASVWMTLVISQARNLLIQNILKMVTDMRLSHWEHLHLHVGPTGFELAPSDLTLDDLEGSKARSYFLT